jgi:hypothetical protein
MRRSEQHDRQPVTRDERRRDPVELQARLWYGNPEQGQTQSEASPRDVRPEGLPLQRDRSTASSLPLGIMKAVLTTTFATSHWVA